MNIEELNLDERVKSLLRKYGIVKLFPPQKEAIERGVLEGKNIVVSAPTASGKTLIAELAIVKNFLEQKCKAIYLTPLRALALEKYRDISKYSEIGLKVALTTGDYDSSDPWLGDYDVIVTTNEKADSLIRHKAPWLHHIKTIVIDEVHLVGSRRRGATLEILVTLLKHILPEAQFIALSATISNAEELAEWLEAELIKSNWRPVPLREGIYLNQEIIYSDGTCKSLAKNYGSSIVNLTLEVIEEGGQVLIFTSTRQRAVNLAMSLAPYVIKLLSREERNELLDTSRMLLESERNRITEQLAKCIRCGTAFHHAGLSYRCRQTIEDKFRDNTIKVIVATPTLAAGVNLPARRVIVYDYRRYNSEIGVYEEIPVMEYKQMSGRAGRPKYDKWGEAILIARNKSELMLLMDRYVLSDPESIVSRLSAEHALRAHVLAIISTGFASTTEEIFKLFSKTLFSRQSSLLMIRSTIMKIINFLEDNEFIKIKEGQLLATVLGRRVSELYIDPMTAKMIICSLKELKSPHEFTYLHMIAQTPDMPTLYLRRGEKRRLCEWIRKNYSKLLYEPPDDTFELEVFLAKLKVALLLNDWINELSEDRLIEKYDVCPGDIYSISEKAEWLLYSAHELAKLYGMHTHLKTLLTLRERVKYGVKEELLELTRVKGIGRVRARILYNYGFKSLKDILTAPRAKLLSLPLIGPGILANILKDTEDIEEFEEYLDKDRRRIGTLEDFLYE